ncbi:MAG: gliding motility protein GldM [Bacteroidetes bacterium]|jgi:gliding motility-associated protein GldM|nr:gliding motility protein GldM [Bacteroidota bacterium]
MAGGKQSPRQKMIGMMYLVLTALLALNVSKEIITSFIVIESGLIQTNKGIENKNGVLYSQFDLAKLNDEKKAGPFFDKAMKIKAESKKLYDFIQNLKAELKMNVEGLPDKKIGDTMQSIFIAKPDDYDIPTNYMIGEDPANVTGKAKDLKAEMSKYKKFLEDQLAPDQKEKLKNNLATLDTKDQYSKDNEKMVSWEWYNFYHMPITAMLANLTRLQINVKNAEGDVVAELLSSVSKNDFKFDTLAAKVVAPTSYVLSGDKYRADLFVAAFSTTQDPQIWLCDYDSVTKVPKGPIDSTSVKVNRGIGTYEVPAAAVGLQKWSGLIRVKKPDNTFESYPFKSEYIVAAPSAAVFLEKMNVFYIGVDNPISISAAGVAPSDLQPSLSGGSMSPAGKPGSYIVRVTGGTEATINVGAKLNGINKPMGSFKFRVKRVPDPVAYVGNIKGDGQMTKAELLGQSGVFARMENFDFDLSFKVVSFVMSMNVNGAFVEKKGSGPALTGDMKSLLQGVKPGNKVFFEQVTVQGPDGSLRKIPGVNIKVK